MTAEEDERPLSRLGWNGAAGVSAEQLAGLMGPGAPFEQRVELVCGRPNLAFVRQPRNLRAAFELTVARQPDQMMIVAGERRWTFSEAIADVEAISRVLVEQYHVGKGDRVAIVAANSPEYALTMWAVISVGGIVSSLNGWWTGAELQQGIELTEPKVIVGDEPRLARLDRPSLPPSVPVLTLESLYAQARSNGAGDRSWRVDTSHDDPAVILFTSGTTGFSKGATLSHRNIVNFAWANFLIGAINAIRNPRALSAAAPTHSASIVASPMFHVSGMIAVLMTGAIMGVRLVFPPPGRWDAKTHLDITTEHGVSAWSGVPTQWWRLLRHPDLDSYDLSCVLSIGGGGAPFPPELVREFNRRLPWVTLGNGYGMSETAGLGTRIGGPDMVEHPDSVGGANPGTELEIRDEHDRVLPEGEVGEIHMRTASLFLGYWNNEKATAAVIDANGWYRTGDYGRVKDGRLYLESRMRDLILRGGENIYPLEIENRLIEHPSIADAAVIGVDHVELGQEVMAFVVLEPGTTLSPADVQRWVGERLAAFKVPAHVEFRTSLPYTESGKVMKKELEAEQQARRTAG